MGPDLPATVIAVDWSGRRDPRGALAIAVVQGGRLVAFHDAFRHHEEAAALLLAAHAEASTRAPVWIGLDFAFGFPARFAERLALPDVHAVWQRAAADGEGWLRCPEGLPFWGRPGVGASRAVDWGGPRLTDRRQPGERGPSPKSPYQVGGAGSVGTGTIRGMPLLARLRGAGAAIWPFDAPALTTVVEIYPRRFTGHAVKSDAATRTAAAHAVRAQVTPAIADRVIDAIARRDDAYDAVLAALGMWAQRHTVPTMPAARDRPIAVEGWIWDPARPLPTPGAA